MDSVFLRNQFIIIDCAPYDHGVMALKPSHKMFACIENYYHNSDSRLQFFMKKIFFLSILGGLEPMLKFLVGLT